MNILIAYYSRTNTTRKIAKEMADLLAADTLEIKSPIIKGKGFFDYLKAGKQAIKKDMPTIEDFDNSVQKYDLVVIGTPVWAGTMASPIRTFLVKEKAKFQKVAFFCTCHDKQTRAFSEMEEIVKLPSQGALELKTRDIKKGRHVEYLKDFTDKLKKEI